MVFGAPREPHIPAWVPPRDSEVFLVAVFDLADFERFWRPQTPESALGASLREPRGEISRSDQTEPVFDEGVTQVAPGGIPRFVL